MSNDAGSGAGGYGSGAGQAVDVLLVEDNPGDVRLTEEAFETGEVESRIHVVRDGVEALDYLYQRGAYADVELPDLVLLDLNLPRKNGDAVLREIREDPEFPRLPVIVLSSSADDADVARSYELEANAYLTKPVAPGEFAETVEAVEQFWLSTVRLPPDGEQGR